MKIATKQIDYRDPRDSEDLVRLLTEYAQLELGAAPDLSRLPQQLAEFPTAFSVLAYADHDGDPAIGLTNCFFGFSTFSRRRLVNVHDVIVTEQYRGRGVGGVMLDRVEKIAMENDCCRLTLEVRADNDSAKRAYQKHGFIRDPSHPHADTIFLHKPL